MIFRYWPVLFLACSLSAGIPNPTHNDREAMRILGKFLLPKAKAVRLSKKLIPKVKHCQAFFTKKVNKQVCQFYIKKLKASLSKKSSAIKPRRGETKLLIWRARAKSLRKKNSKVATYFPAGYREVAKFIRKNHVIYRFKFVRPGESTGRPYDGLVKIKGKWKIFRRPWHILPYVEEKK